MIILLYINIDKTRLKTYLHKLKLKQQMDLRLINLNVRNTRFKLIENFKIRVCKKILTSCFRSFLYLYF
jgi:hypothetical protein